MSTPDSGSVEQALAAARSSPDDPQAWLTLARLLAAHGKLIPTQQAIVRASSILQARADQAAAGPPELQAIEHKLDLVLQELAALRAVVHGIGNGKPAEPGRALPARALAPTTNGATPATNPAPVADPTPSAPAAAPDASAPPVVAWLTEREFTVRNHSKPEATDEVFDRLAMFLGNRYGDLSQFMEGVKRNIATGNTFSVTLATNEEIQGTTQFCTMLKEYAFLSYYEYYKNSKTVRAAPQKAGKVQQFLTGGWFERYVYQRVTLLLSQAGESFEGLTNIHVVYDRKDSELDILFLIRDEPLWIECKTGDYQTHIARFADLRRRLNIPKERAFLVILGITSELARQLAGLYDIQVTEQEHFLAEIDRVRQSWQ